MLSVPQSLCIKLIKKLIISKPQKTWPRNEDILWVLRFCKLWRQFESSDFDISFQQCSFVIILRSIVMHFGYSLHQAHQHLIKDDQPTNKVLLFPPIWLFCGWAANRECTPCMIQGNNQPSKRITEGVKVDNWVGRVRKSDSGQ